MTRTRVLVDAVHARAGGGVTYLRALLPLLAADPTLDVHVVLHPEAYPQLFGLHRAITHHVIPMPSSTVLLFLWEQTVFPFVALWIGYDVLFCSANFCPLLCPRAVVVLHNATSVGKLYASS